MRVGKKRTAHPSKTEASKHAEAAPVRLIENRALPVRFTQRSIIEYFADAEQVWRVLLVSIPFDLLLLSAQAPGLVGEKLVAVLQIAAPALLCVSALFLFRTSLWNALQLLLDLQRNVARLSTRHSTLALLGVLLLIGVELVLKFGRYGFIALVAVGFVLIRAALALRKTFEEQRQRYQAIERDSVLALEISNRQLFLFSVIPLFAARIATLAVALASMSHEHSLALWAPYAAAAVVLLFAFCPQQEDFIITCRRCARWTSKALERKGCCPVCAREEFQVRETTGDQDSRDKERNQLRTLPTTASKSGSAGLSASTSTTAVLSKSYEIARGLSAKFLPRTSKG